MGSDPLGHRSPPVAGASVAASRRGDCHEGRRAPRLSPAALDRRHPDRRPGPARGAHQDRRVRRLPQRSARARRRAARAAAVRTRARARRHRARRRRRGHPRAAGRPRDRLPQRLLRQLRLLPARRAEPVRRRRDHAREGRQAAPQQGQRDHLPDGAPLRVRGRDARARDRRGEDQPRDAARPRRPDRLRRRRPASAPRSTPRRCGPAIPSPSSAAAASA